MLKREKDELEKATQTASVRAEALPWINSWEGKTVIPFVTNAGWPGSALDDMKDLAEPAKILEPLEVRFDSAGGSRMVSSPKDIEAWAQRVKKAIR